ncbi:MAG: hypothetical protein IPK07_05540 [Deltaproteobacteria bacterium]|nr:hypothetical protein [Deltaproteobacteria bacterium]
MGIARVLDHVVGFFSLYAHLPSVPHPDTLKQVERYFDLPVEECSRIRPRTP